MWWFLIKKKQQIKGHFLVITRTVAARKLLHQQKQKWSSKKPGWQQFLEGRSEEARSFGSGKRRGKIITTEEQKKLFPEDWQHPAAYVTQKKKDQNSSTPCLEIHHFRGVKWEQDCECSLQISFTQLQPAGGKRKEWFCSIKNTGSRETGLVTSNKRVCAKTSLVHNHMLYFFFF